MTFRPSVLPDRDNDILSTFVRSFERARQLRRADQADARAQQEANARQEDREAKREATILQSNLAVAADPSLSFERSFEINQIPGTEATVTAEDPTFGRVPIASARGPDLVEEEEGEAIGRGPGGREIFFSERAGEVGRESAADRAAEAERERTRPEREEAAAATAQERTELANALRAAEPDITEAEVQALVRDRPAALRRINQRETGTSTTAARQRDTEELDAIMSQAERIGKPIDEAQAIIFRENPRQFEDFLRPIPQAQQDIIMEDLDRMQELLDDIESDELSNPEKLTRKKRALIDGGFMGPAEDFNTGLQRFQASRDEARQMAGTFLGGQAAAQPGAGPAAESGLAGDEPRRTVSPTQIPAAAALIEDLNFAERNAEIDRVFPGISAGDRAAIMRAAGPAPVISGQPGSQVGDEPGR